MIHRSYLPLTCVVLVTMASASDDGEQEGTKELTGSWQLVYSEAEGIKRPVAPNVFMKLVVEGKKWTETASGEGAVGGFKATFTSDASKSPSIIDITIKAKDRQVTWQGIYKVDSDTLTVCRTLSKDRPREFQSDKEATIFVFVYKRLKE